VPVPLPAAEPVTAPADVPGNVPDIAPGITPAMPAAVAPPAAAPPAQRGRRQSDKRRSLQALLAAGLAAGLAGAGWWAKRQSGGGGPALAPGTGRQTLAVLPFKPLVAEGRDELLEVGMADSLIARLSTVPGLVVRSVGSVLRYAGPGQDPVRAAHELEVVWIVDGSLQRRGEQLRATARLLRAADGTAAWSGSFDEKFTGVFDMQDQISNRVMQALAPTLQAEGGAGATAPLTDLGGTRSIEAYQLYLAASQHAQGLRADGLRKSLELLNQALTVDPGYALAWVKLAEIHKRRLFSADAVPSEVFEPIKLALQRALALAPDLAQAHAEIGFSLYWFDFDWPGAEREFRRALALNPNVVMAHYGLGMMLATQDRIDEGFAHLRQARELDPMSLVINTIEAGYLLSGGRRAEARARLARVFDIAPNFWLAHATQGLLLLAEQQDDAGIAALRRAVALADGSTQPVVLLGVHLARLGQQGETRALLKQMLALSKARYVPPTSVAALHAALGEVAPALALLAQAVAVHDTRLIVFKDDPRWAGLRTEPGYLALLKKLKLDRYGPGLSPP